MELLAPINSPILIIGILFLQAIFICSPARSLNLRPVQRPRPGLCEGARDCRAAGAGRARPRRLRDLIRVIRQDVRRTRARACRACRMARARFDVIESPLHSHARACRGHPRLFFAELQQADVDGRDKPGHDSGELVQHNQDPLQSRFRSTGITHSTSLRLPLISPRTLCALTAPPPISARSSCARAPAFRRDGLRGSGNPERRRRGREAG
jgi:hypothetical protein